MAGVMHVAERCMVTASAMASLSTLLWSFLSDSTESFSLSTELAPGALASPSQPALA